MSKLHGYTNADILEHLDGLTESQLLPNSALIYAMGDTPRTNDLINHIRFNSDITLEELKGELEKINSLWAVTESGYGDHDSARIDSLKHFRTVIESAIRRKETMSCTVNEHTIYFLENQLFDDCSDYKYTGPIVRAISSTDIGSILKYEDSRDKISPCGIAKFAQILCDPLSPVCNHPDSAAKVKDCLMKKVKNTLDYEMCHDEYSDLPVIHTLDTVHDFLGDVYHGIEDVEKSLNTLFTDIADVLREDLEIYLQEEAIKAEFNPNPFGPYNVTAWATDPRIMHYSLMKLASAETDEELDEAALEYARLENAVNHIVTEAKRGGIVSKAVRGAARVSAKATDKVRGATKAAGGLKKDVSKIGEPMAKFAEETLTKMKEADKEERRNLIIKGGVIPKAIRWVKRGIGLVIVGSLGTTGAVIAVVGLLTMIAIDARLDSKERVKILRELEDELNIVEEKIDDSRGDEDKQKKYELIRIRNKLRTDIQRIKLRLRD